MKKPDPKVEFARAFKIFDRDGNGAISAGELRQVMINLDSELTGAEIEEMFRRMGQSGKEEMDQEEFIKLLMNSH